MRAVLQRVKEARVTVNGEKAGEIGPGLLIFMGVEKDDTPADAVYMASKIVSLRIFADGSDKFNLALLDVGGECLIVSQFTLLSDCRKGKRPSFDQAAPPALARQLYEFFVTEVRRLGVPVATGEFQAKMEVSLVNDGPVTILLDSRKQKHS
ncbi:MAG: D-aminoacyl-tRNA deacylase [Thermodesulfobacteriota bacterium]|nr:D-aminoacyl-tRNA deacylase [Thermodesulfobacteriota bacterium]